MRNVIILWTLSLTLLLCGCGSSPRTNYYLLTAENVSSPSGETPALGIGPIEIPEYLKRGSIIYQRQGNTLEVATADSWAEPLEDGIVRVMTLNLASQLNTHNVRSFPWHPERAPDYGIKVNLFNLDANNTEANLSAEWLIYRPGSAETVQRRISKLKVPLSPGKLRAEQVALAYSTLLEQLSTIIADVITADQAESKESEQ